jgi:hypothetical protein
MRVIVDDVSTSYLFVGTPELGLLRGLGIAAVHSIRSSAIPASYDPAPLDRLAVQLADQLKTWRIPKLKPGLIVLWHERDKAEEIDVASSAGGADSIRSFGTARAHGLRSSARRKRNTIRAIHLRRHQLRLARLPCATIPA